MDKNNEIIQRFPVVDYKSNTVTLDDIINCLKCDQNIDYCVCDIDTDLTD